VANNILDQIKEIYYCPADIVAQGNPCLEVGDPIILETRYARIETIIFQRKLKGIQALTDSYSSKGAKENKKNLNSLQSQIQQTQGKINEVKADLVTATKAIIDDLEANYATIATLEANYATITSLQTVDGKIDNLTSIAITTQNLSAQNISANQINAGTLSVNYLDVNGIVASMAAKNLTVQAFTATGVVVLGGKMCYWHEDAEGFWLKGSTE
jgi:seryl-tRNA synthetase